MPKFATFPGNYSSVVKRLLTERECWEEVPRGLIQIEERDKPSSLAKADFIWKPVILPRQVQFYISEVSRCYQHSSGTRKRKARFA